MNTNFNKNKIISQFKKEKILIKEKEFKSIKTISNKNFVSCLLIHNNLLYAGSFKIILIYDLDEKKINKTNKKRKIENLIDFNNQVNCIKIYKNLLIASCIKIIKIFEIDRVYNNVKNLNHHKFLINCMEVYKNLLISGSTDKTIQIVNLDYFNIIKVIDNNLDVIKSLWTNNSYLFSGTEDNLIKIYNLKKNFLLEHTINDHDYPVNCLTTYENLLISGSYDNLVNIYDINNNYKLLKTLIEHNYPVDCLLVYNNILITGSEDNNIKFFDLLNNFILLGVITEHTGSINSLAILDNNILISSSFDKDIKFFQLKNKYDIVKSINEEHKVTVISMYKYLDLIIVSYFDKTIQIFKIKPNYILIHELKNEKYIYKSILCYKNKIILGGYKFIKIWDISLKFKEKIIKNIHNDMINCMVNINFLIFTGSEDRHIKVLDFNNGFKIVKVYQYEYSIRNMITCDNYLIFTFCDLTVNFFDINKNIIIHRTIYHSKAINRILCYNNYLISCSSDQKIKVLDLHENFKEIYEIEEKSVVQFVEKYKNFLITATNNLIKVYNIEINFELMKVIKEFNNVISFLLIDEDILYCGLESNSVKFINIKMYNEEILVNILLSYYYNKIIDNEIFKISNLKSIFNLFSEETEYLKGVIWNNYLHFNYYLIKFSDNSDLFRQSLEIFGYDKLLFSLNPKYNLFNIIIKENKIKIYFSTLIDYWIKNNIDNQIDYDKFVNTLILIKNEEVLVNKLLTYVFKKSIINEKLKYIKLLSFNHYILFNSKNDIFEENDYNKNIKSRHLNFNKLLNKKFEIYNFGFKLPKRLSDNKILFDILLKSNEFVKLSNLKYLVYYFFDKMTIFKYINLILFIWLILFITLGIAYDCKHISFFVLNWILIIYFLLFEILQFALNYKSYFKSMINIYDLFLISYNFYAVIRIFNEKGMDKDDILIMFLYYINGVKLLILMKSINYIRKQIRLFIKVWSNTLKFMVFISIILIYLSIINFWINYDKFQNFPKSVFEIYAMMIGTFSDDFGDFSTHEYIQIFINIYIFNIILLNLFISIVGDIFSDYNSNKERYNIEEKLYILKEYSSIYLFIEYIKFKFFHIIKKSYSFDKRYIFVIKEKSKIKKKDLHTFKKFFINNLDNVSKNINLKINDLKSDVNFLKDELWEIKGILINKKEKNLSKKPSEEIENESLLY